MSKTPNEDDSKQKKNNKLANRALIAFLVFFVVLCGCGSLFVFQELVTNRIFYHSNIAWGNLEGISSLVTMALVIGGLVFAYEDRRQKEKVERLENQKISYQHFEDIHSRLTSPEQEEARRWIYENIPVKGEDEPLEKWLAAVKRKIKSKPKGSTEPRTAGQKYVKMVLNNFDFIGFIFTEYWEAEDKEIEWLSPPIAKVWRRIGPYVEAQREERGEPDYYKAASQIGEYALQWREENGYQEPEIIKDTV